MPRRASRHALAFAVATAVGGGAFACEKPLAHRPLEMEHIGTVENVQRTPDDDGDGGVTTPNSGTPFPGSAGGPPGCTGSEFENLAEALRGCEVPMPNPNDVPPVKDKLEVKVTSSTPSIAPGGRVDLTVLFRNTSSEALALYFTGDPNPQFDVEALDARGRRVDVPSGKWPGYPRGQKPEPRPTRASRVTLDRAGTARLRLSWDAVKVKWAPDKAKTWEGRGHPRVPAGPLPKGKYTLRVFIPLFGDVDVPKVPIQVDS